MDQKHAKWWADDVISNEEFVKSIEILSQKRYNSSIIWSIFLSLNNKYSQLMNQNENEAYGIPRRLHYYLSQFYLMVLLALHCSQILSLLFLVIWK